MTIKFIKYVNESYEWKWIVKVSNLEEYDEMAEHLTHQGYLWNGDISLMDFNPIGLSNLDIMPIYLYAMLNKYICYGGKPGLDDNYDELLTVKEYIQKYPIKESPFNPNDPYGEEVWYLE